MAAKPELDATGSPRKGRVIRFLIAALMLGNAVCAQNSSSEQTRLAEAKAAFDSGHWEDAARLARGPLDQSPDLDFLAGLALARLEKWNEAKVAFEAGARK